MRGTRLGAHLSAPGIPARGPTSLRRRSRLGAASLSRETRLSAPGDPPRGDQASFSAFAISVSRANDAVPATTVVEPPVVSCSTSAS